MTISQESVVPIEVSPWSIGGSARFLDAASDVLQRQLASRTSVPTANALPESFVLETAKLFDTVAEALRRHVRLPAPVVSAVTNLAWSLTLDAARQDARPPIPSVSGPPSRAADRRTAPAGSRLGRVGGSGTVAGSRNLTGTTALQVAARQGRPSH